ncbi:hypothetical protein F383_38165 [Gossypium arboreum]|uniref:Uncharacterized protein n=1 Tax=Gossypium arboreum TaxID=29729 RepID=A0A0B0MEJ4_GOSAR|nr:hypothetical protein F383_38165 [Gossypium arboreum]
MKQDKQNKTLHQIYIEDSNSSPFSLKNNRTEIKQC